MTTEVQVKDLVPVRSRISWGAILAGVMTSVAVYFLLSILGIAIGASVIYRTGDPTNLNIGAPIWGIITLVLALFCGGWVSSQCTVGENKTESVIYGVVLWGAMFTMLAWLMATGLRVGFVDLMSLAGTVQSTSTTGNEWRVQALRNDGFSDADIQHFREANPSMFSDDLQSTVQHYAQDPRTVNAAWWTFGGILLSMLAAISGAVTGAGPSFSLAGFGFRSVLVTNQNRTGQTRTAV